MLIVGAGPVGLLPASAPRCGHGHAQQPAAGFSACDITDYDGLGHLIAVGFGEVATAVDDAAVHFDLDAQPFHGHPTDTPHAVPVPA